MKKITIITAAVAALAAFAACTKEIETTDALQTATVQSNGRVQIDLGVTKAADAGTPDTKAIQSGFMKGNAIFVFFNDDKINGSCQSKFENKEYLIMTYDGSAWTSDYNSAYLDTLRTAGTMDAIYVSDIESTDSFSYWAGFSISNKNGTLKNSEKYYTDFDILTAEDQTYTIEDGKLKGTIALSRAQGGSGYEQLNLQISVSNLPEGDWYLKTSGGSMTKAAYYGNYTTGEACSIQYSNKSSNVYVKLNPVQDDMVAYLGKTSRLYSEEDLTFYLYDNATNKTYIKTVNTGLASNESSLYKIWNGTDNQCYTHNTALKMNFSTFEEYTQNLSATATANCYIVSAAGKYKFNASVKGNGSESVGTVASAAVLWESFGTETTPTVGDLVSDVTYADGYVTFRTSDKKGNAVIAAKDASDNILWSWHIWMTDKPTDQVYNNEAGTMMDRNLGATSATPGEVGTLGLLYQWGRKDPFLGGSSISSSTKAASTTTWLGPVDSDATTGTLEYATANPTTFIRSNWSNNDWNYTGSSSRDDTRWQTLEKDKGLYDPCPAGYRVPAGDESGVWCKAFGTSSSWTTSTNWDGTYLGMDFGSTDKTLGTGSIWYPAAGSLDTWNSSISNVGSFGFYWSCTPTTYPYSLGFHSDGKISLLTGTSRSCGRSVRCCKD